MADKKDKKEKIVNGFSQSPVETLRAGADFDLASVDPESTPGYDGDKSGAVAELASKSTKFEELQELLFANSHGADQSKKKVLLVLQAMDTAGKGGIVKHVVGSADPQGIEHYAFKAPTDEEKAHDFLWRIKKQLPGVGKIQVFDRSHYEEVLIHKVQKFATDDVIEERYDIIKNFEQDLIDDDTIIVKIMLHISKDEQKKRLLARLDDPTKYWKYSPGDVTQRLKWDDYQEAYQIAISKTSTDDAPWYVVPANKKWYARLAVQQILIDTMENLNLKWPKPEYDLEEEKAKVAAS